MSLLLVYHTGEVNQGTAFQRVIVDFMVLGTSRITWTLDRNFNDPWPENWTYQLQVSEHGQIDTLNKASGQVRTDDWVDVGSPVTNAALLTDTERRAFGKALSVSYRVKLVTPIGIYYSDPATTLGALNKQDWLRVREIIRKEQLLHKKATSVSGYIFKRKRKGTACPKCTDPSTNEVKISKCNVCNGAHFIYGYFAAYPYAYCLVENIQTREHMKIDSTGPTEENVTKGRIIAVPGLESYDIWVDGQSDLRYYIHTVGIAAKIRNVPVVYTVELRQAPFNDIAYTLSLEGV